MPEVGSYVVIDDMVFEVVGTSDKMISLEIIDDLDIVNSLKI